MGKKTGILNLVTSENLIAARGFRFLLTAGMGIFIDLATAHYVFNFFYLDRFEKIALFLSLFIISFIFCQAVLFAAPFPPDWRWITISAIIAGAMFILYKYQLTVTPLATAPWLIFSWLTAISQFISLGLFFWLLIRGIQTSDQRVLVILALIVVSITVFKWPGVARSYFNDQPYKNFPPNIDFQAYYAAGKKLYLGFNPYLSQADIQAWKSYIYPPVVLILFGLFAELDYGTARTVWLYLYSGIFLAATMILVFLALDKKYRLDFLLLFLSMVVISHPLVFLIQQGQIDLLVISLVILSYTSYYKKHYLVSAVILSIAAWIKINPALFLFTFVLLFRNKRYLLYFLLCGLGIGLLSLLWTPPELHIYYFLQRLPVMTSGTDWYKNQSLIRFVYDLSLWPQIIALSGYATLFGIMWWVGRKTPEFAPPMCIYTLSLNALFILLFSAITWHMAYVWMLVPSALALPHIIRKGNYFLTCWAIIAILFLQANVEQSPFYDSLNIIGAVLFASCLVFLMLKPPIPHSAPPEGQKI